MADDLYVSFRDVEVGSSACLFVTPDQAEAILSAGLDEKVQLDEARWIRLQRRSEPGQGERVYYYSHGESGGYGYVLANENELRRGLSHALFAREK